MAVSAAVGVRKVLTRTRNIPSGRVGGSGAWSGKSRRSKRSGSDGGGTRAGAGASAGVTAAMVVVVVAVAMAMIGSTAARRHRSAVPVAMVPVAAT